jgi:DnaJ like chaperone protein
VWRGEKGCYAFFPVILVHGVTIWTRIADALATLTSGEGLSAVFDTLRTPQQRSAGFAIAVIALGAKMAKADGTVTREEVVAFREVFTISKTEEPNAAHVFNLARQDVAGFEEYARRISGMFDEGHAVLVDILEGLFHIAIADGAYHPTENEFLKRVSEIFGTSDQKFRSVRARFVPDAQPDPYEVLGVTPDMSKSEIRTAWRQLVRDSHPDVMIARGVPQEALKMAEKKLIAINRAWDALNR